MKQRMSGAGWPTPPWRRRLRAAALGGRGLSMASLVDRLADLYEDRPVYLLDRRLSYPFFRGNKISYRSFSRLVNRTGNALRRIGVARGERVGLVTMNRIEMAFAMFAVQKIGAVAVPINSMLKAEEIRSLTADSGCRVLLTDRAVFDANIGERSRLPEIEQWVMVGDGAPPRGFYGLSDLLAEAEPELEPVPLSPQDVVLISYTAGTTGKPKGAMLTNQALLTAARGPLLLALLAPMFRGSVSLLVMPLAHTSGYQALLLQMVLGWPTLFLGQFYPEEVLEMMRRHRVAVFSGVPAMYKMLLEAGAEGRDLSSLRVWGGGGDAFSEELVETFRGLARRRILGLPLLPFFTVGYGMAEVAGPVSLTFPAPRRGGWLGWPLPGLRRKVVDAEGRKVRPGEVGELLLRGPRVMQGYWRSPAFTASVVRDGWFHTGDLVRRGRLGSLYMAAREKEVIKSGAYSVFPAEVESQLAKHPAIERVVVVGVPHEIAGEVPVAAVVTKAGRAIDPGEVLAWARRSIAPYKCPRQIVVVDEIPLSSMLKPMRMAVRESVRALLADGVPPEETRAWREGDRAVGRRA